MSHQGYGEGHARRDPGARVDDEIRHHIEESADLLEAEGLSREAALEEAHSRFGNLIATRDELTKMERRRERRARAREWLGTMGGDMRLGVRGLRRNPGFAVAVILTLALGTGVASPVFSVLDAALLRPLPYRDAERLVEVAGRSGNPGMNVEKYRGWVDAGSSLVEGWIATVPASLMRTDGLAPERVFARGATADWARLVGLPLLLGRSFSAEDVSAGSEVAVLGRGYYRRLGEDPAILGSTIRLGEVSATVIGVLQGGVKFPDYGPEADIWLPIHEDLTFLGRDLPGFPGVWARLREGRALAAAQEMADALAEGLQEQDPQAAGWDVRLVPVGSRRGGSGVVEPLSLLSATVALILLIALVNAVSLLLARATARSGEFVVRAAIGGSRFRLLRQLLAEGVLLGVLAGGVATLLCWISLRGLKALIPETITFFSPFGLQVEGRTFLFVMATSVLGGVILGLVPAAEALRPSNLALRGRRLNDSPGRTRVRKLLVVMQTGLAMTLLAGAGLFANGFVRLLNEDPGYDVRRIAQATISFSAARYPTGADRAAFLESLDTALEASPAIESATSSDGTSLSFGGPLQGEGREPPENQPIYVPYTSVEDDYDRATGTELVAGRAFGASDVGGDVAIIDRDLARFLWGNQSPVGRRFRVGDGPWREVVGVARELRLMGRDQREGPYQFLLQRQPGEAWSSAEIFVRAVGDPAEVLPVIRDVLQTLDPAMSVTALRTAKEALAEEEQGHRFVVTLMALLAGIGVALAVIGLFGLLAYSVRRRRQELGVRAAIGAKPSALLGSVLRSGVALAAFGVVLGLGGTLLASDFTANLLYEIDPLDPVTLAACALLFLVISVAASLLPAFEATRVNPVEALQAE